MSYFPTCDFGPHGWIRKKHLVYVALAFRGDAERWRLRFCPEHVAVLQEDLAQNEVVALESTVGRNDGRVVNCLTCGEPIGEQGWQLFVTCYPTQDKREDYWARVHSYEHLPAYLKDPYRQSPDP